MRMEVNLIIPGENDKTNKHPIQSIVSLYSLTFVQVYFLDLFCMSYHLVMKIDAFYIILAVLGIIGNLFGLFLFSSSRRTWRISSVYACLATCSSLTNLLCVIRYTSILHSTTRDLLRRWIGQNWWACKIYEFSFSFRVISSWITLFWMFERVTCLSTKIRILSKHCCSPRLEFLTCLIIITTILSCVIGPPVYMYQHRTIIKYVKHIQSA